MEKLIFKYLSGKADLEEKKRVRNWILESEENVKTFCKDQKSLYYVPNAGSQESQKKIR